MKNPISVDEARLRPHLRRDLPASFHPGALSEPMDTFGQFTKAALTLKNGKTIKRTIVPTPGELRGIPVERHGGAVRGSKPEPALIAKEERAGGFFKDEAAA